MLLRKPFEEKDKDAIIAFLGQQPFVTLVSTADSNLPVASHLPVDLLQDSAAPFGYKMISHIANDNPHVPLILAGGEVLIIVMSNTNYISPSWFVDKASAPTQSHQVVHVYGKARLVTETDELIDLMKHQVKTREEGVKGDWTVEELGKEGLNARLKRISGVEIKIDRVDASFRLLQDESKQNVESVLESAELDSDLKQAISKANRLDD